MNEQAIEQIQSLYWEAKYRSKFVDDQWSGAYHSDAPDKRKQCSTWADESIAAHSEFKTLDRVLRILNALPKEGRS